MFKLCVDGRGSGLWGFSCHCFVARSWCNIGQHSEIFKPDDCLCFIFLGRCVKAELGHQIEPVRPKFLKERGQRRSGELSGLKACQKKSWKEIIHPICVFLSKEEDFNLHKLKHKLGK